MKPEEIELVQLHTAMVECFDEAQIHQIGHALLETTYGKLNGTHKRDKIRELLLAAQRRGLIPKLTNLCQQAQANFSWHEKDVSVLYQASELANHLSSEQLVTILANQFSLDDLRQISLYLGIDFEEIKAPYYMWGTGNDSKEIRQGALLKQGIDTDVYSAEEIDILLKKVWAEDFANFCKAKGMWAQAVAVCVYLHPEAS